jgi:hypothetical protein
VKVVLVSSILACAVVAGCAMPIVAPDIPRRTIPERNEISRVWREFASAVADTRVSEAWPRLSVRCRKTRFHNSESEFATWVAKERTGLLAGIDASWLTDLSVANASAHARPEGLDGLRRMTFVREQGAWRIDGWTLVPGP